MNADGTVRRRGLRERIQKTRHRYWGKGGEVNVPELTDQILKYLHEQGVQVADDDWEAGVVAAEPQGTAELDQLHRWLLAVTLGQATKDMHAEMREYLRRIGW